MDVDPERPAPHLPGSDPAARRRRLIKRLVIADLALTAAALAVWFVLQGDDPKENAVNAGLRGSKPPAGQVFPDLAGIAGVEPSVPTGTELEGEAVQLVATCLDCRSGDIIGGYLGRLERDDVPDGARVLLVGWDGDLQAWQRRWRVDTNLVELHVARTPAATGELREAVGIGPVDGAEESGIAFLYDTTGRWRSTFFLGQLDRDDVRHDLTALARTP